MYLTKAYLVVLPSSQMCLIPLEEIKYGHFDFENPNKVCEILKSTSAIQFWIFKKNSDLNGTGNEKYIISPLTAKEIFEITSLNNGICYIEVNHLDELRSPTNSLEDRAIIIHLAVPEYISATKEIANGFIYEQTEETCSFCEKEKIVSGLYLEYKDTGYPCCKSCYNKPGFNEWFNDCLNRDKVTPKKFEEFIDIYYRQSLTSTEAAEVNLRTV